MILEIFTLCTKYKSISWSIKYDHGQCLSAFWPDDLDVYMRQFPPQGGTWYNRLILKVTSCGRKCAANKLIPGSPHDRRHIMTSPGHTGISRRDIQTSAPYISLLPCGVIWWHTFGWILAIVKVCCSTAPSHYLSQCWFIISNVRWQSSEDKRYIPPKASINIDKLEKNL